MSQCFLYNNCNHINCDKMCQRKLKMSYLLEESELPESLWLDLKLVIDGDGADRDEFKHLSSIKDRIVHFVQDGANLFIHSSNSGNGKTSWAIKLALAYVDRTWKSYDFTECAILFVSVPTFLEAIKHSFTASDPYADRLLVKIPQADLVIWDDIAAKTGSDYEVNKLLSLIDGRYAKGKANIYTSNLNSTEINAALGSRLCSRICRASTDIELCGGDKRGLAVKHY